MKNAFTLIELLAVITILSLIALVVFPTVNSVITSSKNKAYETQKETILKAAKEYFLDNIELLPDESDGNNTSVTLQTLVDEGYISQNEVKDPRDKTKQLSGSVKVTYQSKQYVYDYIDSTTNTNMVGNWIYQNASDKSELKARNGIYKGENPNNYVTFSGNTWRIIKINNDNSIKMIRTTSITSTWGNTTAFGDSTIKNVLNNSVSSSKITSTSWCVGKLKDECQNIANTKVGLITTSEYIYASTTLSCNTSTGENCNSNNYLNNYSGYTLNNDGAGNIYYIKDGLSKTSPTTSLNVYPVITLGEVTISSGTGTKTDPYIISDN